MQLHKNADAYVKKKLQMQ